MKHLIHITLLSFCFLAAQTTYSQDTETEKIWATFNDLNILPDLVNGQLVSSSDDLQELINEFTITDFKQILPDSRKDELLRVYEVSCECDQYDLITAMIEGVQSITGIEPAPKYELLYEPDDYNLIFAEDYALDLIGAQEAWEYTMGDSTIELAISDSNFDLDHQEFAGTTTYIESPLTHPNIYHGTAVATTAAGNTDNATGKSSIGANCMLQLYSMSYANFLTATYSGAKVINVSWTSGCSYSIYYQSIIDEVYENGTIVVAAAGNGSTCGAPENYVYPASLDHVISVSSIGPMDNHERVLGDPTSTHQHNDMVDICAPGYDVALTVIDGWYLTGNGTSFAAPYVTGTIGLMLSINPCLTFEDVEFILDSTSANIDILNPAYAGKLGSGQLHAAKAVEMASQYQTFNFGIASGHGCTTTSGSASIVPFPGEGTEPFDISWSNGESSMTIEGLEAGSYEVIIIDDEGCVGKNEIAVSTSEQIVVSGTVTNVLCNADSTGTIESLVVGGTAPFSYTWSSGENTEIINDISSGDYILTVVDVNDCDGSDSFVIYEPEVIELEVEVTNDYEIFGGSQIDLVVTGGTSPYEYLWSNSATSEDLINLEAGVYDVLVTDANGCVKKTEAEVFGPVMSIVDQHSNEMNLYPNPSTTGVTYLTWDGAIESQVIVTDAAGKIVSIMDVNGDQNELQISDLSAGFYLVTMRDESTVLSTKKLIIRD